MKAKIKPGKRIATKWKYIYHCVTIIRMSPPPFPEALQSMQHTAGKNCCKIFEKSKFAKILFKRNKIVKHGSGAR